MRILIVDDERSVADTLVMILEREGHEAEAAYASGTALERLNSFAPDCVISDVIVPEINGIDLCGKIEAKYPNCHIILFSGQAETNDLIQIARAAGNKWELLAKPLDPDELLAKLNLVGSAQGEVAIHES